MGINKSDILSALGLEEQGIGSWVGPALIGFGIGAVVGAAVALLVTPKTGYDLREELFDRGRRIVERGREKIEPTGARPNT